MKLDWIENSFGDMVKLHYRHGCIETVVSLTHEQWIKDQNKLITKWKKDHSND